MRLALLTTAAMVAFAANSILNRLALAGDEIAALPFAALRLTAGAAALLLVLKLRGAAPDLSLSPRRLAGVLSLWVYMLGFSLAYVTLDAGLGALILFGGVQATMFAGAVLSGDRVPAVQWAGTAVALGGLVLLLWPGGAGAPAPLAAALMAAAALGWGVYSLIGRGVRAPTAETASNFLLAAPLALLPALFVPWDATARGIALALLSGMVTSAGSYALWYALVPQLGAGRAALAQLTVPVIAVLGGALLLGEAVTLRIVLAGMLVLGGVALGLGAAQRRIGSSGS